MLNPFSMSYCVLMDSLCRQSENPMTVISFLSDQTIKLEHPWGRWMARRWLHVNDWEKEGEKWRKTNLEFTILYLHDKMSTKYFKKPSSSQSSPDLLHNWVRVRVRTTIWVLQKATIFFIYNNDVPTKMLNNPTKSCKCTRQTPHNQLKEVKCYISI